MMRQLPKMLTMTRVQINVPIAHLASAAAKATHCHCSCTHFYIDYWLTPPPAANHPHWAQTMWAVLRGRFGGKWGSDGHFVGGSIDYSYRQLTHTVPLRDEDGAALSEAGTTFIVYPLTKHKVSSYSAFFLMYILTNTILRITPVSMTGVLLHVSNITT